MRDDTRRFFARIKREYLEERLHKQVLDPAQQELEQRKIALAAELAQLSEHDGTDGQRADVAMELRFLEKAIRVLEFERERFRDMDRYLTFS